MKSAKKKSKPKVGGGSVPPSASRKKSGRKPASAVDGLRHGKGPSHIRRKPFVAVTFAMTVDGKITTRNFSPVDFTSREDKAHLFRQRALGDAVLIGHSTLKHDNVRLGLPDPTMREERIARGQMPYPIRVIVSNEGRIDPSLKIFQTEISPIVIFSTTRMPARSQKALRKRATL